MPLQDSKPPDIESRNQDVRYLFADNVWKDLIRAIEASMHEVGETQTVEWLAVAIANICNGESLW